MKASTIITNAKKYLGCPYVWGGESMSEGGYDCSGYVCRVLWDSGENFTRTTAQGLSKKGKTVTSKATGDLLFFGKSKSKITHVAIYAGNNKMYESIGDSTCTKKKPGKGVTLSSVSRRSDLVLIRRVVNETEKTVTEVAKEVIAGKWGNGSARKAKLESAGYDYAEVQKEVNRLLKC